MLRPTIHANSIITIIILISAGRQASKRRLDVRRAARHHTGQSLLVGLVRILSDGALRAAVLVADEVTHAVPVVINLIVILLLELVHHALVIAEAGNLLNLLMPLLVMACLFHEAL